MEELQLNLFQRQENIFLKRLLHTLAKELEVMISTDFSNREDSNVSEEDVFAHYKNIEKIMVSAIVDLKCLKYNYSSSSKTIITCSNSLTEKINSDIDSTEQPWEIFSGIYSPPPIDFYSPEVHHILTTWTPDDKKVSYFKQWVESLKLSYPNDFPAGVQIVNISQVVKEAFLVIIIPIIKAISIDKLEVSFREHKVSSDSDFDPFVRLTDVVYDLRVRRLIRIELDENPLLAPETDYHIFNEPFLRRMEDPSLKIASSISNKAVNYDNVTEKPQVSSSYINNIISWFGPSQVRKEGQSLSVHSLPANTAARNIESKETNATSASIADPSQINKGKSSSKITARLEALRRKSGSEIPTSSSSAEGSSHRLVSIDYGATAIEFKTNSSNILSTSSM